MKHATALALFFLLLQLTSVLAVPLLPPIWIKISAYAEYRINIPILFFANGTMWQYENSSLTYRWACLELNGSTAKLEISLYSNEHPENLTLSSIIFVDIITRSVFLPNGSSMGLTRLWLPKDPTEGQEIVLWDQPPDRIVGTVKTGGGSEASITQTPQGKQRIFIIGGNGILNGQQTFIMPLIYDFSTGLLLQGPLRFDPTLQVLGVKELLGGVCLEDTNIDLGPPETSFDISKLIPVIAIVAAFLIAAVSIYRRCRRREW